MIESFQNKTVKYIKSLRLKKERDRANVFVAEGVRFVDEIESGWDIELIAFSNKFATENDISGFEKKADSIILSDAVFESVTETDSPQGILAVCKRKSYDRKHVLEQKDGNGFYIIAEEMNDPGNLGTIIRTADAAGADGIFLSKGSVDLYNSKTLRSTMGSIFHIPIFQEQEIKELISEMKKNKISIYASHLKAKSMPYESDFKKGCAFLIGNESKGLKEQTASLADKLIKIPMPGKAESLNASIAAGILLYEAVRQRFEL